MMDGGGGGDDDGMRNNLRVVSNISLKSSE